MTHLAFGVGSRLLCRTCLEETFHTARGKCCHCDTLFVAQCSPLPAAFNAVSAKTKRSALGGRPRVQRPDRTQLRNAVHEAGSMAAAGRRYGVSEKTVHRWLLSYGITARDRRGPKSKDVPRGTVSQEPQ